MDYSQLYDFIVSSGRITNIGEKYILYYDETNNPRTFKLTNDGFNVNEHEYFILGGIGFEAENTALEKGIDKLFSELLIQRNATEVKFNHIRQNARDFLSLISKPKVNTLIEWIYENKYIIHYSYIDNFYYTIVDIVDSLEESYYGGLDFNRQLKDSLYSLIKEYREWFISLLIEVDYPNIKNHKMFVEKIIDWISTVNIGDDFYLEYLRQSLKTYREKQLIFLENNEDKVAISNYSTFYANLIVTFPNSDHIFDQEPVVEKKLNANPIEISGYRDIKYKFVDSKNERLVQISDLIVGILRHWMVFLESFNIHDLNDKLNNLSELQKSRMNKFKEVLLYSLSISTGFKHGVGSNEFELKVKFFLEYDFYKSD